MNKIRGIYISFSISVNYSGEELSFAGGDHLDNKMDGETTSKAAIFSTPVGMQKDKRRGSFLPSHVGRLEKSVLPLAFPMMCYCTAPIKWLTSLPCITWFKQVTVLWD